MPTNIVLNPGLTTRYLQDAVADRGEDFSFYDPDLMAASDVGCSYVNDEGGACCIVAEVLKRSGFDMAWFDVRNNRKPLFELGRTLNNLTMDAVSYAMLVRAQSMQDQGATWGDCLEAAEAILRGTHSHDS